MASTRAILDGLHCPGYCDAALNRVEPCDMLDFAGRTSRDSLADVDKILEEVGRPMKINLENRYVELIPETDEEKETLESLWQTLVDCVGFNRKLSPIGEYVPKIEGKGIARFSIEGRE